ncbi:sigma54 specific transcriptional regulator, Fis family [Magnetococcus marinus MC-1]|uniref:Sigma54 specific transcriptional regulator, Fis family n=1 Tax=Magnetococcus marinus (strain ATCC BAA-1437 / JCM 17883 / MC-1) TaxID=156889 RepID=A0L3T3_MAGMM|nr:sigma-54 dependent transcriptional regulator [Magnetococcus marinus]ABK42626.1 sigma54 specific transcriptional regulator, Fis family [Magnetococcus marinus MC-1]
MTPHDPKQEILTRTPEMESVMRAATLVAQTNVTVLITGESGTGKERIGHLVHAESRRNKGPWVPVNCAALQDNLAESELFGHVRGAFTGATDAHQGRVRASSGGTLFLDEVGELSLPLQAKLLRLLENSECQVVGQAQPVRVDIRIVAATNVDLAQRVREGLFREDLFYRLNIAPLTLPPLRDRPRDIPLLMDHFLLEAAARFERKPPRFTSKALQQIQNHRWPGNIRELLNFCTRMVIYHGGEEVDLPALPVELRGTVPEVASGSPFDLPSQGVDLTAVERGLIKQALERATGNKSKAARLLGLTRDTLLYRLKKHTLD